MDPHVSVCAYANDTVLPGINNTKTEDVFEVVIRYDDSRVRHVGKVSGGRHTKLLMLTKKTLDCTMRVFAHFFPNSVTLVGLYKQR